MANINSEKAKLIFTVISDKKTHSIRTQSVFDNRTHEEWTDEHINILTIVAYVILVIWQI